MENNLKKISIVIPARNEEETLPLLLDDIDKVIKNISYYDFEIIVVDDNSKDKTSEIANLYNVKLIRNKRSPGKGNALISGFENATGEIIIMMDADYSHRAEDIPLFIKMIEKGYGLVVGSRATGGSDEYTHIRTFGNIFLTNVFCFFTGKFLTDSLNGFKAFRKEVFTNHFYKSKDFEIEIELLVNTLLSGYEIGEIPSHERARAGGKMKSKVLKHGFRFLWKIITKGIEYQYVKMMKKFNHNEKK